MADHNKLRRTLVACRRCRRIVEPPTPEEKTVLADVVTMTDAMLHALEAAWLACLDSSDAEARRADLQRLVDRTLTPGQRTTLQLAVNYLDRALAHPCEDPRDDRPA